ncbi:hypothetical protein [Antarcticimicrobium luteum]|uniref:Uncharacterized protein n=1 Tax=Antarcticimicrobium luteum TaxID=2547397 RepID=A0A4R5V9Z8_9RHOB|nr:hypothetical protein [Antarcticimicrobium luteum]TDK48989.1 hypothetical protein E1832_09380 [Antarcticimicrobium luteum]
MNDSLFHLAKLYELIASMEKDLGLHTLSEDERAMIYAITSVTAAEGATFLSADIKKHSLCSRMSNPTFYRNLKRLLQKDLIRHVKGKKTGLYEVAEGLFSGKFGRS